MRKRYAEEDLNRPKKLKKAEELLRVLRSIGYDRAKESLQDAYLMVREEIIKALADLDRSEDIEITRVC